MNNEALPKVLLQCRQVFFCQRGEALYFQSPQESDQSFSSEFLVYSPILQKGNIWLMMWCLSLKRIGKARNETEHILKLL